MKYAIWNKKDNILTPIGEILTAEQWIERYPIAGLNSIVVVCAAGEINGAFFGTLGSMVENYEKQGVDFSQCKTPEEKLWAIENFELEMEQIQQNKVMMTNVNEELTASSLASIAASLEYQNMLTLENVEV